MAFSSKIFTKFLGSHLTGDLVLDVPGTIGGEVGGEQVQVGLSPHAEDLHPLLAHLGDHLLQQRLKNPRTGETQA